MRGPTYVFAGTLKTSDKVNKWVLAGVCLLMNDDRSRRPRPFRQAVSQFSWAWLLGKSLASYRRITFGMAPSKLSRLQCVRHMYLCRLQWRQHFSSRSQEALTRGGLRTEGPRARCHCANVYALKFSQK